MKEQTLNEKIKHIYCSCCSKQDLETSCHCNLSDRRVSRIKHIILEEIEKLSMMEDDGKGQYFRTVELRDIRELLGEK